jgi:WD40 repeat protein/energy-coupling factor transporter ATP-binding protein EcfA2
MREVQDSYKVSHGPYPGLRAYRKEESDIFFGRDEHIDLLIANLSRSSFVCVTGPSGCGKSSLVRTGLINSLEAGFLAGRGSDWIFCDFHPGNQPLEAMMRTLSEAVAAVLPAQACEPDEDRQRAAYQILEHGIKDSRSSNDLNTILSSLDLGRRPVLLFVDQFEELFRYAQSEPHAAVRFVDILLRTAAAKRDIYVVITIRTDELEKCARYTGLTRAINESQFLTPTLDRYQIQEAIEGPIAIFGGKIDPKLTIWLLNSLDEELDKLPLMQHALKLLYAHKTAAEGRPDVSLAIEDFISVFDFDAKLDFSASESRFALRDTLARRLDAIYGALPEHQKRPAARMFCALTAVESGSRDIRRPLTLSHLAATIGETVEETRAIVAAFESGGENYLIVRGGEDGTVDVPHECILRLWPRLQTKWLANERESSDNIRDLARRAKHWDTGARQASFFRRMVTPDVLKGYALQGYRDWFETRRPNKYWASRYLTGFRWRVGPREAKRQLSTEEIYDKVEQLVAASTRYRRQFQWSAGIGAAATLAAMAYVGFVKIEANDIERQKAYMSITHKVAKSKAGPYPVTNLAVAAQAAGEAIRLGEAATSNVAAGNLWEVLATVNEFSRATNGEGAERELFSALFAPGHDALLTLDRWGQLRRWPMTAYRIGAPQPIDDARGPSVEGRSLAVSPLGDVAAVGYNDGSLRVFDLKSAKPEAHPLLVNGVKPHGSFILNLTFAHDGSQLFTSSHDGTIWSWSRAKPDGTLAGAEETSVWIPRLAADTRHFGPAPWGVSEPVKIWSLDVDAETRSVAFGLENGRVCVVRLVAAAIPSCSNAGHDHEKAVKAVRFQPGRATLVSAGNDDHIAFWRLTATSNLVPTANRIFEESDIWDLDFSDDGRLLAAASWDGSVRIYDPDNRRLLVTLAGHEHRVRSVRFDHAGRVLVTGSWDGTARTVTPFETRVVVPDLSYRFPQPASSQPKKSITSVALGAEGSWVAFHDRSTVFVKSLGQDEPESLALPDDAARRVGSKAWISHLAVHPAAPIITASSKQPAIAVWTREAPGKWAARILGLPGERLESRPLALSADGRMLAVATREEETAAIRLCWLAGAGGSWDCLAGATRKIAVTKRPGSRLAVLPTSLAFSPTGRHLIVGVSDGTVRMFDLAAAAETVFEGQKGAIVAVSFGPDGESFLSASADGTLRLWNSASKEFKLLKGHKSHIAGAAFAANGQWIASASQDETVMIWNAADAKPLARLPIERDSILSFDVRSTPRGTYMATGSAAGNVSVMHFFETADEVLQHAKTLLAQNIGLKAGRPQP